MAARDDRKVIRLQREKLKTKADHAKEARLFSMPSSANGTRTRCVYRADDSIKDSGTLGITEQLDSHRKFATRNLTSMGNARRAITTSQGMSVEYRINLLEKIGPIEHWPGLKAARSAKYTVDDLKQIMATYKQKLKDEWRMIANAEFALEKKKSDGW